MLVTVVPPVPEPLAGADTSAGVRAMASLAVGVDENPFSIVPPSGLGTGRFAGVSVPAVATGRAGDPWKAEALSRAIKLSFPGSVFEETVGRPHSSEDEAEVEGSFTTGPRPTEAPPVASATACSC